MDPISSDPTNLERVERRDYRRIPGGSRADDLPLTVSEFANWLGYPDRLIRRAIRRGELRASNLPGPTGKSNWRIELLDAVAWLKARKYTPVERIAILERVAIRQQRDLPSES